MGKKWTPYLMDDQGNRTAPLLLGREFHSRGEIQQFFQNLPRTNPKLVGKHIEFEEESDVAATRIVVPGRGT